MLYSIGRAAVRRVVAGAPHLSTTRSVLSIWHLQREAISKQCLLSLARKYATATTATKATKATKATRPKAKTTATKSAAKAKTTKTPAKGKKKTVRKVAKKKTKKPKKKTKAKKKAGRKVLTEKQKEARALTKQRDHAKELKARALLGLEPKYRGRTAWQVFFIEKMTGQKNPSGQASRVSAEYKALTPADMEHLNHRANENIAHNRLAYKRWVESHTPDQIRQANNARVVLRRQHKQKTGKATKGFSKIDDPRLPQGNHSSFNIFIKDRWDSGDLKGIGLVEASKLLSREWKALTPAERKVYNDKAAADTLRFQQEYETVYKHPVPSRTRTKAKST